MFLHQSKSRLKKQILVTYIEFLKVLLLGWFLAKTADGFPDLLKIGNLKYSEEQSFACLSHDQSFMKENVPKLYQIIQ